MDSVATGIPLANGRGLINLREPMLLLVAVVLAVAFSVALPGFASVDNWSTLLKSVSVLGMLSIAATIVIIGGGIDLSGVATMIAGAGCLLQLVHNGVDIPLALLVALCLVVAIGLANGMLVAFFEITPLLATLASGFVVIGITKAALLAQSVVYVPAALEPYRGLSRGAVLGVPTPVLVLLGVALAAHLLLTRTRVGLFIHALGDNSNAASVVGLPRRRLTIYLYLVSALVAFLGGLVTAGSAGGINVQVTSGTLVFDVILVAVIGGASLSGGQGRISGVLVAALLVGIIVNGMTLMNVNNIVQDIFKSVVLLFAIMLDRFVHPIDLETARQGDL